MASMGGCDDGEIFVSPFPHFGWFLSAAAGDDDGVLFKLEWLLWVAWPLFAPTVTHVSTVSWQKTRYPKARMQRVPSVGVDLLCLLMTFSCNIHS